MLCLPRVFQQFLHQQLSLHFHLKDFLHSKIWHLPQIADGHIFLQTTIFFLVFSGVLPTDAKIAGTPGEGRKGPWGCLDMSIDFSRLRLLQLGNLAKIRFHFAIELIDQNSEVI